MNISIIIPCYNAIGKIEKCINSLLLIDYPSDRFEVIFIDDKSQDGTSEYLKDLCHQHDNWTLLELDENSGSPSQPRNEGIKVSRGKYIFFLDCDDEIISDTLTVYYNHAEKSKADIIRGYLLVDNGVERKIANRISSNINFLSKNEKITEIIRKQSTTVPSFILRKLLIENKIFWDSTLRMGEDTVFLIDVLVVAKKIFYIDHATFIYNKKITAEASSTQTYGSRELQNHLKVWRLSQNKLLSIGINYYKIRLQVGLQTAFQSMISYNSFDITKEDFTSLKDFVLQNINIITNFNYSERLKNILNSLINDDYSSFLENIKQRMVVAGYDLKFIKELIPYLENYYQIQVDEWTGHNTHDEKESFRHLNWADIVFCEWMLGNAVWYSNRIKRHQKLFIRMHRFELTTNWYTKINFRNVNKVFAVSVYFFEKLIEYTNIPRALACLLPNYLDTKMYEKSSDKNKLYNLGIIGILPSRKGYIRALKILNTLVKKDKRYKLFVYGKMPQDVSWIQKDHDEMFYFNECQSFIEKHELTQHVIVRGWVNVKTELKNIGFILSTSEKAELFESFHIAPADGFAAGNQGVMLNWNGVEYIYPQKYIFSNEFQVAAHIAAQNRIGMFEKYNKEGLDLVENKYSVDNIISLLNKNIKLSSKLYMNAPFPFDENRKLSFTEIPSLQRIEIEEINNAVLMPTGIEIKIPDKYQSNSKIIIEYSFDLTENREINAALISLKTDIKHLSKFNISNVEEIGIYRYLDTINPGSHVISIDIPKENKLTALSIKLWKKDIKISIKSFKVVIEN